MGNTMLNTVHDAELPGQSPQTSAAVGSGLERPITGCSCAARTYRHVR